MYTYTGLHLFMLLTLCGSYLQSIKCWKIIAIYYSSAKLNYTLPHKCFHTPTVQPTKNLMMQHQSRQISKHSQRSKASSQRFLWALIWLSGWILEWQRRVWEQAYRGGSEISPPPLRQTYISSQTHGCATGLFVLQRVCYYYLQIS